jgi:hypothetical protein
LTLRSDLRPRRRCSQGLHASVAVSAGYIDHPFFGVRAAAAGDHQPRKELQYGGGPGSQRKFHSNNLSLTWFDPDHCGGGRVNLGGMQQSRGALAASGQRRNLMCLRG